MSAEISALGVFSLTKIILNFSLIFVFVWASSYVHRKGWQHYFKTYCIPEDLVPRILSPAYFHHYNAQPLQASADTGITSSSSLKPVDGAERSIIKSPHYSHVAVVSREATSYLYFIKIYKQIL